MDSFAAFLAGALLVLALINGWYVTARIVRGWTAVRKAERGNRP